MKLPLPPEIIQPLQKAAEAFLTYVHKDINNYRGEIILKIEDGKIHFIYDNQKFLIHQQKSLDNKRY